MRFSVLFLALLLGFKSPSAALACAAPLAKGDDKVVFLNAYSGAFLSTQSIAGQDDVTTAVIVMIGKGRDDLHIVAAAGTPVIWEVTGEVARVSAFVAVGPATRGDSRVKAGVLGLEAAKTTFAKIGDCIPVVSQDIDSDEGRQALASVRAMAGRAVAASRYAVNAQVFSAEPTATPQIDSPASGGIHTLENAMIIAGTKAEAYKVLPREAGLEQLVKEGKIIKLVEGYKIVKEIPRYPAGLTGVHAVRFILGKGIAPPSGDPGHSCVMLEESERPINARIANNCK